MEFCFNLKEYLVHPVNKELLWIKWIHDNYLKNRDVLTVNAIASNSWLWKQMLKIRDKAMTLIGGIDNLEHIIGSCYKNSKVKTSALYVALSPASLKVPWFNTIWERMNYPKNSIISWLAVQNRLLTQDMLLRMGTVFTNSCCLCSGAASESCDHLFFEFEFSKIVWNKIMKWIQFRWLSCVWNCLLEWYITSLRGKRFKQRIKRMAFNASLYRIWNERNARIFLQKSKGAD
ncbi:uncharacterized protein LOC109839306 [Asparagus officinalis]|uniref:uncharacterized protein LOC109839306 n=1 Tax=Asparagus officinalis TaxID=4686 RepID=UPI00098E5733|nr:uncharacterized protein LOC109839306 [Asparagus officinalis]